MKFQYLQSDKAQNSQPAQTDHPHGLERLLLPIGFPHQGDTQIHVSFIPECRNNLRKRIQSARPFQPCFEKRAGVRKPEKLVSSLGQLQMP